MIHLQAAPRHQELGALAANPNLEIDLHDCELEAQITKTSMSKEIRSPDFLSMSKDVEKMLGSRKQPGIQYEQGPPSSITHALQHPLKEVETSDIFGAQVPNRAGTLRSAGMVKLGEKCTGTVRNREVIVNKAPAGVTRTVFLYVIARDDMKEVSEKHQTEQPTAGRFRFHGSVKHFLGSLDFWLRVLASLRYLHMETPPKPGK
ncbi:cysS [Symbiodinium microadriaticum]|nr:cysS [Symbiodinium microadriaticum]